MMKMIDNQMNHCTSSSTQHKLKKWKTKLEKENEGVLVHSDILRQYSSIASSGLSEKTVQQI